MPNLGEGSETNWRNNKMWLHSLQTSTDFCLLSQKGCREAGFNRSTLCSSSCLAMQLEPLIKGPFLTKGQPPNRGHTPFLNRESCHQLSKKTTFQQEKTISQQVKTTSQQKKTASQWRPKILIQSVGYVPQFPPQMD